MPVETEYYETLSISVEADESQIKRAYKKMALKYHPDKCRDPDAEQKFKAVGEAYDVLSNPDKKRIYDTHGKKGLEEGGGGSGGVDASDIFSAFFGGRPKGEPKPKDIVHEIPVSLEDFYNGRTRKLAATRDRFCGPCEGTGINPSSGKKRESFVCGRCRGRGVVIAHRELAPGFVQQMQIECSECSGKGVSIPSDVICQTCNGKQVMKERKVLEVHIEKGMKKGDHVVFSGEGDQRPGMKMAGNILIVLGHKPHPFFQRRGRHLFIEHEVTLNEALTGFALPIEHLDGRQIVIKTRPHQVLDPQKLWVIDARGYAREGHRRRGKGKLGDHAQGEVPREVEAGAGAGPPGGAREAGQDRKNAGARRGLPDRLHPFQAQAAQRPARHGRRHAGRHPHDGRRRSPTGHVRPPVSSREYCSDLTD
ncbi:DnaJ protein-like protein [Diplonema papillatum]|nr:DnaJ protein-like protein [Diplonema papillatum]